MLMARHRRCFYSPREMMYTDTQTPPVEFIVAVAGLIVEYLEALRASRMVVDGSVWFSISFPQSSESHRDPQPPATQTTP